MGNSIITTPHKRPDETLCERLTSEDPSPMFVEDPFDERNKETFQDSWRQKAYHGYCLRCGTKVVVPNDGKHTTENS